MITSVTMVFGVLGAVAGAFSAYFWLAAAKVPPVYNTAVLSGPAPAEKDRIDKQAKLNARGATMAALAVLCQAIVLALGAVGSFD